MLVLKIEVSPFFTILEITVFCLYTFSRRKAEVSFKYGVTTSRYFKEAPDHSFEALCSSCRAHRSRNSNEP